MSNGVLYLESSVVSEANAVDTQITKPRRTASDADRRIPNATIDEGGKVTYSICIGDLRYNRLASVSFRLPRYLDLWNRNQHKDGTEAPQWILETHGHSRTVIEIHEIQDSAWNSSLMHGESVLMHGESV